MGGMKEVRRGKEEREERRRREEKGEEREGWPGAREGRAWGEGRWWKQNRTAAVIVNCQSSSLLPYPGREGGEPE